MSRRIAVPALFLAAASAVGYALMRLRQRGPDSSVAPQPLGNGGGEESEYRCDCGQEFRVAGAGRHRVY